MKPLINYIENFVKLDQPSIDALYQLAETGTYAKGSHVLEAGQRCNKIWFIVKGMVRKYQVHDGREITAWIHTENDTFTSLESYARNTPSGEYLQACENTEVIFITRENSRKLAAFQVYITFTNTMMEREFINVDTYTKAMNLLDARGKYEYLGKIAPEIIKRAKLRDIASIIGVTPETLSRIRRG